MVKKLLVLALIVPAVLIAGLFGFAQLFPEKATALAIDAERRAASAACAVGCCACARLIASASVSGACAHAGIAGPSASDRTSVRTVRRIIGKLSTLTEIHESGKGDTRVRRAG